MTGNSQRPSRAKRSEEVRRQVDASLDRLAQALDAGQSDQMKTFLRAMSRFHRYSFQNVMLIVSQRPDATRVAGFQTWKSLGRSVNKGEKGIAIFAPMLVRARNDDDAGDDAEAPKTLRFRVVHVFDVSQTDGEPLPEPAIVRGDAGAALPRLEAAVRARGIELAVVDGLGPVYGVSKGGRIELRAGLDEPTRFATLVHEFAHELLHQNRGGSPGERPPKLVRETEAEAVAFVVCDAMGIDARDASSDYIQGYDGNRETLAASLSRIQKAAAEIIAAIEDDQAENTAEYGATHVAHHRGRVR